MVGAKFFLYITSDFLRRKNCPLFWFGIGWKRIPANPLTPVISGFLGFFLIIP